MIDHQLLVLLYVGEVEVKPAEGSLGYALFPEGFNAISTGGVPTRADDEGRTLLGVEAGIALLDKRCSPR